MAETKPKNLAEALIAFQASVPSIETNRKGQHGAFADLPHILSIIRPALAKAGLAVIQVPSDTADGPGLRTTLMHSSGEKETAVTPLCINKEPMKTRDGRTIALNPTMEWGKAVTYQRRYALQAILGICIGMEDIDPDLPAEKIDWNDHREIPTPKQAQQPAAVDSTPKVEPEAKSPYLSDDKLKDLKAQLMSLDPDYRQAMCKAFIPKFDVPNGVKVGTFIKTQEHADWITNYMLENEP